MRFLLDADALIKLNRADILETVLEGLDCAITSVVYDEVVTKARSLGYADADLIDAALTKSCEIRELASGEYPQSAFGPGELSLLELAGHIGEVTIVSDDRQFLRILEASGVPGLGAAGLVVLLRVTGRLASDEAVSGLERMRPAISPRSYASAQNQLALLDGEMT